MSAPNLLQITCNAHEKIKLGKFISCKHLILTKCFIFQILGWNMWSRAFCGAFLGDRISNAYLLLIHRNSQNAFSAIRLRCKTEVAFHFDVFIVQKNMQQYKCIFECLKKCIDDDNIDELILSNISEIYSNIWES